VNPEAEAPDASHTLRMIREFLADQAALGVFAIPRPAPAAHAPSDPLADVGDGEAEPEDLATLQGVVRDCGNCPLCETRTQVVFGSGNPEAAVMFVGEAPGREEDLKGLPFVGAAGELLTRMITSIGLSRDEVYITNIVKCRPPRNRDPLPDEIEACHLVLHRQIEMIRPTVICTLGRFAAQTLLVSGESMGRLRGRTHDFQGIKLVPTYHPAALLRNAQWKRPTWEDLKRLRLEYDGLEL